MVKIVLNTAHRSPLDAINFTKFFDWYSQLPVVNICKSQVLCSYIGLQML